MILADSSVWIDHIRHPVEQLIELLADEQVVCHPFVTGEIALGSIASRDTVIARLGELPQLRVAEIELVASLIERRQLWGCGIAYVDCHLLASAMLEPGTVLWTRDKRLHLQAERLGVAFAP